MTWILTANSNLYRIYHFDKDPEEISLVKEISHPDNKKKISEVMNAGDRPGHYQTDNNAGGAYSPRTDPKEVEIDNFSREIAQALNQGRNDNAYSNLIIITSSRMYGLICAHLDKHVKALIKKEIQKDVMELPHHELQAFLKTHLKLS